MIESRKFVAAAILTGIALILAGLLLAPASKARAAAAFPGAVAERIGGAFAAAPETRPAPAIVEAADRAGKGDLLVRDCTAAVWPNVEAACLTRADGEPARAVRSVTIGYEAGPGTTILVRLPSAEIAQR